MRSLRSHVSCFVLALLITSMLTAALKIQPVNASGTVYIRVDGSIDPPTAPISTVDNVTYILTGNVTSDADGIVVERDNIVVEGSGLTVEGTQAYISHGMFLDGRSNVTVQNMNIISFYQGIVLNSSSSNSLDGNNVTGNSFSGIWLDSSSNNTVVGNNAAENGDDGIELRFSSNNIVRGNTATENGDVGFELWDSSNDNIVSGNNATANIYGGILLYSSSNNNTVSGNNATANSGGIIIWDSCSNNIVSGNNAIANSAVGISLYSSSYNTVSGNNATANTLGQLVGNGIELLSSSNNTVKGNSVMANRGGIYLDSSSGNFLSENMLEDNKYNFCVRDDFPSDFMNSVDTFMNSVDTSNLVNGKPVCYMTSKSNLLISPENYPEIGYLALVNCTNIIVQGLTLTNNSNGILLAFTNNSKITNCTATNNEDGICLYCSSNNTVIGNNATANSIGIHVTFSNNNKMYSNNFNNKMYRDNLQVDSSNSTNMWDDGYPYGGNYWSDYSGIDADHDGIGDTPYVIDANNTDNYPLIGTYHEFTVTDGMLYNIATVSNFTILDLYSLHELRLDGSWYLVLEISAVLPKGTVGFCRIDIPRALIDGPYRVFTLGGNFTPTELPVSNSSHALLYFTFDHSGPVIIVPEFPSFLILPFFFIATLLAVIAHRRKHR